MSLNDHYIPQRTREVVDALSDIQFPDTMKRFFGKLPNFPNQQIKGFSGPRIGINTFDEKLWILGGRRHRHQCFSVRGVPVENPNDTSVTLYGRKISSYYLERKPIKEPIEYFDVDLVTPPNVLRWKKVGAATLHLVSFRSVSHRLTAEPPIAKVDSLNLDLPEAEQLVLNLCNVLTDHSYLGIPDEPEVSVDPEELVTVLFVRP